MSRGAIMASLAALAVLAACGSAGQGVGSFTPEPVPVAGAPARGPADAWVTMVEFADFECPYCQHVQPALLALHAAYPDDLRLVYRHFPLTYHARARPAAIAAECAAEQGRFWEMSDVLWAKAGALAEGDLAAAAVQAGVPDFDAWNLCRAGTDAAARVDADKALGVAHGVPATPTFFVNGGMVVGDRPYAELRATVEEALARAKASGIPRASYYDVAILGKPAP